MTISVAAALITLVEILHVASVVFAVLYIVYSSRYFNEKAGAGLYLLAVLAPLVAVIVQLVRKKHFQGAGMKVCGQCGEKLPPNYQVCPRCLAELDPYDEEKPKKDKNISRVMLALFCVGKAVSVICVVTMSVFFLSALFSAMPDDDIYPQRMSVTVDGKKAYYDKKGVRYDDPEDVVLYAQDGTKYVYDDDLVCYVDENNDEYSSAYCYVDSDGWFYYDADDTFTYVEPEDVNLSAFEDEDFLNMDLRDLFSSMFSFSGYEVWCDEDGNVYYWADTASWNEKGELITSQYEVLS